MTFLQALKPSVAPCSGPITRFRLSDGRRLAFEQWGRMEGEPVFFFHGLPGSRLQRPPCSGILNRIGVRMITIDRPGFGCSDPVERRRLLDWPKDVAELADALGIERFRVIGYSAGGPHAAATAYALSDRVIAAAFIGGVCPHAGGENLCNFSPYVQLFFRSVKEKLPGHRFVLNALRMSLRHYGLPRTPRFLLPPADRRTLYNPVVNRLLKQDLREALRQGIDGAVEEGRMLTDDWEFDLRDIRPPVVLYHGTRDTIVRRDSGAWMCETMPHCEMHFIEGSGHFDLGLGPPALNVFLRLMEIA